MLNTIGVEYPESLSWQQDRVIFRFEGDWRTRPWEEAKALNEGSIGPWAVLRPPSSLVLLQTWKHGGNAQAVWSHTAGTRCPRAGSALPCCVSWVCSFSRFLHTQLEKFYYMISKTPSDAPESGKYPYLGTVPERLVLHEGSTDALDKPIVS